MKDGDKVSVKVNTLGCGFAVLVIGLFVSLAILMVRFALSFNF